MTTTDPTRRGGYPAPAGTPADLPTPPSGPAPGAVPSTAPQPAQLGLASIEARAEVTRSHIGDHSAFSAGVLGPALDDMEALVAEVRRQRAEATEQVAKFLDAVNRITAEREAARRELSEALGDLGAARAVGEKLRRALVGQHEAAGHALEVHAFGTEECAPCQQAADEFDGDKACDRWKAWQAEYEAAVGLPLSTVPPAGTACPNCDGIGPESCPQCSRTAGTEAQ